MKKKKPLIILILLILIIGIIIFFNYKYGINLLNKDDKEIENKKEPAKDLLSKEEKKSIFKDYYSKSKEMVKDMTIEEKVGQLFLVRYRKEDVEYLSNFYPGGYILFARDFENHNKESISKEIEEDQAKNKYPLIIGVDEEGGLVTRVSRYGLLRTEKFQSPKYYYEQGGYEELEKIENEKAILLKSLGINLNLAPVADVSVNENDFIYDRAFGYDAEKTSEFITNMVNYANNNKINSCLKHFPGYGNNIDTHTGIAIDNRTYQNFLDNDFKPFEAGIKANVPSILVSHNIITAIDDKYPASLSEKVINELRNTLNFTGIIMTDDLAMDAVKTYVEDGNAATLAINAGNDMIITSDFLSMKNELLKSLEEGKIKEERINDAVERIIAWKYYSGLFEK